MVKHSPVKVPFVKQFFILLLLFLFPARGSEPLSPASSDFFTRNVAPALAAKCVSCHRPDNLKGNLDLTTREGMLKGGDTGEALLPTKSSLSPVYMRSIPHDGHRAEMPEKGEPLSEKEAADLHDWIAAGAVWPEKFILRENARADRNFWSLQPLHDTTPPHISSPPPHWNANPVDRFILQKLDEKHLAPNPQATPAEFIRRATYDLTGLPPTPEEVLDFTRQCTGKSAQENDGNSLPDSAVASLVDRLLSSPRYGEQWGRHWLDVIRFGESRGYERNEIINNLWPFRDYIIRSFNEDKPFDQLTLEHLAGDIIGKDHPEIEIASAFLVAGPYDDVGNQDAVAAAQIRADQMDEMIRATGEAFLGLTIGCARCHDHKFDPLKAADYYSLYATFAGTVHGQREVSTQADREHRIARLQPLQQEQARLNQALEALEKDLLKRAVALETEAARKWTRPKASRYLTEETFAPVNARFVRLTPQGTDSSDRNRTSFQLDEFEVWTADESPRNVALSSAGGRALGAAREAADFSGAYSANLTNDGRYEQRWQSSGSQLTIELPHPERIQKVSFSSDRPKALSEDNGLTVFVGDYLIETSLDGSEWTKVADSADRIPVNAARREARLLALVTTEKDLQQRQELTHALANIEAQIREIPPLPVWWVGTHREAPGPFHVFIGGTPQKSGEPVIPASLGVLRDLPSAYQIPLEKPEAERRIALARWLTSPDNPLTPRVLANRIWHYHFGTGIVDTPSDFGYMGSRPAHPELLDWLARELIANNWHIKPLHRLIMTSQTYRQSSRWRKEPASEDAAARLLWRFPPRRLSGEEIRDSMLRIAGVLNTAMGGPGFKLYEYQQDNVATYVPLDKVGPETYRRAVYHHNARAARIDLLTDFDCPDPAFADPRRASTTTPLQALALMNHSFATDMSRLFAERLERENSNTTGRIRLAFDLCFSRSPSESELQHSTALIEAHGLIPFCRALLNSSELIHLN